VRRSHEKELGCTSGGLYQWWEATFRGLITTGLLRRRAVATQEQVALGEVSLGSWWRSFSHRGNL